MAEDKRQKLIEAFEAAAFCERWEFRENAAREFVDALDAYLESRAPKREMQHTHIDKREEWQFKRP